MSLYYKQNQIPGPLPYTIFIKDTEGKTYTRTDPSTFTEEEIAMAGYKKAPSKPAVIVANQRVDWNPTQKQWVVNQMVNTRRAKTTAEKWDDVRKQRDSYLKQTDSLVLYNYEHNIVDEKLANYRQALRDLTVNFRNPDRIVWPELETQDE